MSEYHFVPADVMFPGGVPGTEKPVPAVSNSQHIYHHYSDRKPTANIKIEQNTKGFNWSITVEGASTPEEAEDLLVQMRNLIAQFIESEAAQE